MDQILSKTFSLLRFPLAVFVVLIHTYQNEISVNGVMIGGVESPLYHFFGHLFSRGIGYMAVPTFFFISGYLFFKEKTFSFQLYLKKIKSRFWTLLVPYIFWNAWMLLFMFGYQWVGQRVGFDFAGKMIADYSLKDILLSFWDCGRNSYPICFQLWFIRNLIVICVLTPVIYFLMRCFKWYFSIVLILMYLWGIWYKAIPFSVSDFAFFSLGASYSILGGHYVDGFKSLISKMSLIYPLLLAVFAYNLVDVPQYIPIFGLMILTGVDFALNLVYWSIAKFKLQDNPSKFILVFTYLGGISFFIYAFHEPVQGLLKKVAYMILSPSSDLMLTILYFAIPAATIVAAVMTHKLIKLISPAFLRIVSGR